MPTSRSSAPSAELAWAWGSFVTSLPRIHELAQGHWAAVGGERIYYRPDYSRYVRLEQAGLLHCLFGRDHSGVIQGYILAMVCPHIHTQKVMAQDMGIYLVPQHRTLANLRVMFDNTEKMLYSKGTTTFEVSEPAEGPGDRLGIVLQRRRYKRIRTVYELRMER
jgi:hypothetical protein